ncbi:unnamed protein product [Lymnaea stagnalis]|uniref:Uncharacterized protein n=1 Tax=Lymnaea stagnalis TaxID=6523 RepID=A0AAV2IJI5_LYMST
MADRLTIDILQSLTPFHTDGSDNVTRASRDVLISLVKTEPRIHDVFFSDFEAAPEAKLVDLRSFPLATFATLFLAEAITKLKDPYNFHGAISEGVVGNKLREIYESLQWKKLGFQIYTLVYPDVVKDAKTNVSLRDFMTSDGHIWAEKLVNSVYESSWTRTIHQKIVKGKYSEQMYNRDMNALFVKLHLLDPQSVIPAYQFLLNQRALPIVNLELATRNYLGGPLECTVIQKDVERAEHKSSAPVHISRLSLNTDVDVHHGIEVDEFIVTECRNLGLWAGTRPDNFKSVKAKDRCRMM